MQYGGLSGLGALGSFSGLAAAAAAAAAAGTTSGSQNGSSAGDSAGGTASASASGSASTSTSPAMNQASAAWYAMASQLAAQDYLTRLQAAARDPAAYAALASQGVLPNYEMLTQGTKSKSKGSKGRKASAASARAAAAAAAAAAGPSTAMLDSLRLPSDTEIIKYTSSSTGPKVPGTTNRGRKKTISLDPTPSSPSPLTVPSSASAASYGTAGGLGALGALLGAAAAQRVGGVGVGTDSVESSVGSSRDSTPSIPPGEAERNERGNVRVKSFYLFTSRFLCYTGLTIERKKPGRKPMDPDNHIPSSGPMVDRVEITKVPVNAVAGAGATSSSPLGGANGRSCSPSVSITARDFPSSSSGGDIGSSLSLSVRPTSAATITSTSAEKIPSDYYASQALSGVFLAEQIRQQQLAAALESRLSESTGKTAASSSATSELMQAALLMNRLKEQQEQQQQQSSVLGSTETSKLLAIAAAAAAASGAGSSSDQGVSWKQPKSRKAAAKKNTVASLLEQAKSGGQFGKLTPEELELAERATGNPELTIEPLFKSLKPDT